MPTTLDSEGDYTVPEKCRFDVEKEGPLLTSGQIIFLASVTLLMLWQYGATAVHQRLSRKYPDKKLRKWGPIDVWLLLLTKLPLLVLAVGVLFPACLSVINVQADRYLVWEEISFFYYYYY